MSAPRLSIVTASGAGGEFLFRCLVSVVGQAREHGAEVIVVDRCGAATRERVAREHPDVKLLAPDLGHRPSVPELRRVGAEAARGEILAILEEHCVVADDWVATILGEFGPGDAAIGGPILDSDFRRLRDWVVYFCEYHNYMPPWEPGDRYALNGADIAYDRAKLMAHHDVLDTGWWEAALHPLLAGDGRFRAVPAMGARHTGPFDYLYYLRQRYLLSRVWGGTRRDRVGVGARAVHVLVAPLLPLLLLARIAGRVFGQRHRRGRFVATVPPLLPALVAYAVGETLGYLFGIGDALEEVE